MNTEDAGEMRERLAEIHLERFLPPRVAIEERRLVERVGRLTGLSAEEIRTNADEDAEGLLRAEEEAVGDPRVGPGEEEIGAGDEVVVMGSEGGIAATGVLRDVDGATATVQVVSGEWIPVAFADVAHPDSPRASAAAAPGGGAA